MPRFTALFILLLLAGNEINAQIPHYNFSTPDDKIILPEILHEVSGITMVDQNTVACVQDELGIVFFYNLEINKIERKIHFAKEGDFEGIAKADNDLYILRSDGQLTKLKNFKSEEYTIQTFNTNVPADDSEGLCYDEANNQLLIGCKSKLNIKPERKDLRAIYAFDLKTNKIENQPAFEFNINALREFTRSKGIKILSAKKKEELLKLRMSAIAIHPISQKLYLISAKDQLLFVIDKNGKPESVALLDAKLFNKAEGITFTANGDMLISNEGDDQNPTLLRFKMQPQK